MAEFSYRAANAAGALVDGRVQAESREEALRRMRAQGLTPVRLVDAAGSAAVAPVAAPPAGRSRAFARGAVRHAQIHGFTGELSIMLRAGLPIDRALRVLISTCTHERFRLVLEDVFRAVKAGKGFSAALAPHQHLFGDFYINMVRSGEASGKLDEVLTRLADYLERARALRESVVSALIYPIILVVVAVLSVVLMLGFVVPQFEALFEDMGEALPLPTRIIVALGNGVAEWGVAALLIGIIVAWLVARWLAAPAGQGWLARRMLALPVVGNVVRKFEIARFARTMGTLLENGVPIVSALRIASATVGNLVLRDSLSAIVPEIKQGGRMGQALAGSGLFTELTLSMVRLGEETGRLDQMLLEVARVHDNEVQTGIKRALALVEPVLILVLGVVIAAIIVSILMGIMSINELVL